MRSVHAPPPPMNYVGQDDDFIEVPAWKRFLCFFRCYNVRTRMVCFYYLIVALFVSIGLFVAARAAAIDWGFGREFSVVIHLTALLIVLAGHVPLMGLRYEDQFVRDPDRTCDPMMTRVFAVAVFIVVGGGIAVSITLDRWWRDPVSEYEYVHGRGPEHASPSGTPQPTVNPLVQLFSSPSKTPSHTPTPSPDPRILEMQFQVQSDHRSVVGALYLASVAAGAVTVWLDYLMRVMTEF